jgi:predicted RNA-binding protein YlxR (DUF448 family)
VVCRSKDAKRMLIRVVRTPEGEIAIDPSGKRSGRGAYLCDRAACWTSAAAGGALERALKVALTEEARAMLRQLAPAS